MIGTQKTLPVSQVAVLCGVGRTTVGYWIRSRKLVAHRIGRNYAVPLEDLLFFLKNSGQKIPPELLQENSKRPIFKSFQNCWQHWSGSEHARNCQGCIAFKNQLQTCFTVKDSGMLGCSHCDTCRYYQETYLSRIQFVHQIEVPAAVFKDLYLWGGNSYCADLCGVDEKDLIGMGIEKIVHSSSLETVITTVKKNSIGDSGLQANCDISIKTALNGQHEVRVSVYPLREPGGTFLVIGKRMNFGSAR